MRNEIIGILSEGLEDQGVITTILKAFDFDGSEIRYIRPELRRDATDEYKLGKEIGTLQGVKNSCLGKDGKRDDIDDAFKIEGYNNIIIQLDTAEIEEQDFPFNKPIKQNNPNYSSKLREKLIDLVNYWLNNNYSDKLLYAIAVEEIEAWVLTAFENKNSVNSADPKKKLAKFISQKKLSYSNLKANNKRIHFERITQKMEFNKPKKLYSYIENNQSLKDFVISLEQKFN